MGLYHLKSTASTQELNLAGGWGNYPTTELRPEDRGAKRVESRITVFPVGRMACAKVLR